ncbi:MAG: dethiobiotin synthase [Verrucomicrobiota bacterium]
MRRRTIYAATSLEILRDSRDDEAVQSLFLTGTDTGVGKTVLAAALLAAARARGIDAVPMKPVQTGCLRRGRTLAAPDLEFCLSAADLEPAPEELRWMCPYRFMLASSPHLAARKARVHILEGFIARNFRRILTQHEAVVVEGAGGVLVPIGDRRTMLDLMKTLGLPVLLAARPGLGTLNHTLLSLRELRRAGLRILGVVFVDSARTTWGAIERDNLRTIRKLGGVPFVGRLSYLPGFARGRPTNRERRQIDRFFRALEEHL